MQAFYYYRLYEKNSSYISKASICSVFQYSYQQLLYVTNIIVSNETFSKKGYENIIIAFFINNYNEEFYMMYPPLDIIIDSGSIIIIWIVIIFLFIVLIIVSATLRLYSEVKKRDRETENNLRYSLAIAMRENKIDEQIIL